MVATRSSSIPRATQSAAAPTPPRSPLPQAQAHDNGKPGAIAVTPLDSASTHSASTKVSGPTMLTSSVDIASDVDSIIATPSGTIRVRPYVSSGDASLKAVLKFAPRVSSFDRENVKSQRDEFRGFFTLFWIGLALLFLRTSLQSWEENQTLLSLNFGRLITRDAFVLALADGIMVTSMILCVPFVKCLQYGYINYYWTGVIIQHSFQTIFLGVAIWWGYARQWYWVQAGFLVLHSLSCLMKMHSYMAHNGMLATVWARLQREKRALDEYVNSLPGGAAEALASAEARRAELDTSELDEAGSTGSTPTVGTPAIVVTPSGTTSYRHSDDLRRHLQRLDDSSLAEAAANASALPSTVHPTSPSDLRRRRPKIPPRKRSSLMVDALPSPEAGLPMGTSLEPSHTTTPHVPREPNPLAWSSDPHVALLARNIDQMEDELRSNGERGLVWPQNVTYKHFIEFMFFPTLVYQLEYPRTSTIRPLYVIEKVLATFGTFSLIYTITEHYIMPYTPRAGDSLFRTFANLALPMMTNYLLIFYIIFECVCTGFAELSYFADREFYQDWWNSTSWDQFSRKWNKPVHTFLLRHVYASTMSGLRLSRMSATFVTFLLSALCHELVMAVVTKKIRPYLFLLQMIQLPMIAIGRMPIVRRNKTVGNIVFWIGLMFGFPVLAIGYLVF